MKPLSELLESTPAVLKGAVVFKGTRTPVANLFAHLLKGKALHHFVAQYPLIAADDVVLVLRHARVATVGHELDIAENLKKFPTDELFTFFQLDLSLEDFLERYPLTARDHVKLVLAWAEKTMH